MVWGMEGLDGVVSGMYERCYEWVTGCHLLSDRWLDKNCFFRHASGITPATEERTA